MTQTVKTGLAKIIYRNTVDGKIEILRFENVLTEAELKDRFGVEVARIYLHGGGESFKMTQWDYICCRQGSDIATGICTKVYFQDRISYLKQCGKRLGEIRKRAEEDQYTKENVIEI
jgi:hypothetical protein